MNPDVALKERQVHEICYKKSCFQKLSKDFLQHRGEHIDGKQNRRLLVWSLLSFEWWLRKYLH